MPTSMSETRKIQEIYEIRCKNRPSGALMHGIEIPAQKQHAHNGAPGNPIEQRCHFFQTPYSKLQRMTTQNVCN